MYVFIYRSIILPEILLLPFISWCLKSLRSNNPPTICFYFFVNNMFVIVCHASSSWPVVHFPNHSSSCTSSFILLFLPQENKLFFCFFNLFGVSWVWDSPQTQPSCLPWPLPPFSVFLCLLPPCFTEDGQKGERCQFLFLWSPPCLPPQHPAWFPPLFSSVFICVVVYFFTLSLNSPQTSESVFLIIFFPTSTLCSSVGLVPCLTLLSPPAVLSGVFQTFGARQEPPGVAHLSPPFPPVRSDTGTRSSQQQLQEDELAAGRLVDSQTVKLPSHLETSALCRLLYL